MSDESIENAVSIPQAAKQLGLDSFNLYGLIQRDKVRPQRARRGELVILKSNWTGFSKTCRIAGR
jgi:hypothetical protein